MFAAVNVTAQLISWNSTQSPVVSHNSVYTIAPLGSKQFLSFDLKDTLAEAGVKLSSMSQYFMHLTVSHHLASCACVVLRADDAGIVVTAHLDHYKDSLLQRPCAVGDTLQRK